MYQYIAQATLIHYDTGNKENYAINSENKPRPLSISFKAGFHTNSLWLNKL